MNDEVRHSRSSGGHDGAQDYRPLYPDGLGSCGLNVRRRYFFLKNWLRRRVGIIA